MRLPVWSKRCCRGTSRNSMPRASNCYNFISTCIHLSHTKCCLVALREGKRESTFQRFLNVYLYFNEETRCPYEENSSFAAAICKVLLNNGRNCCARKYRRAQLESTEFCSKRKLGPIVGTTSNEASETENQIKTLLAPHKQKQTWGTGMSDRVDGDDANFRQIASTLPTTSSS